NANYSGVALNGKNGSYLPMTYVVDHVVQTLKALEKENPSHPFLYCVDKDVTDIRRGNIYPLDVFLGPRLSNDSGPQVTESRVDRIIQAKGGERYVTDIVYYARVMHSVLLDSRFENDHLVFRFSEDVLLRLADPRLLDRSYPPRLVFTPKMKAAYGSYLKSLKGNGYANDEKDSCEWIFKRGNVPIHVAPAWSVPAMRSRMLRDRRDSYSELYLRLLEAERRKKTSPRTKEPPEPFDPRNEPRSSYILVRTPQEEDYCADLVCGLAEREVLSHIVVFGNERNWRVRHDLFDMIEVGVTSITQIYEMQRNDLDRQRTEAYRILESYLDAVLPTRPKAGDLVTSALYELEDLCGRQIASDAKFRIV
ncbi:MAG: hypothetical protein MJZ38_05275, partial [archaeon]|nr:hypothetical protein [archaeon]